MVNDLLGSLLGGGKEGEDHTLFLLALLLFAGYAFLRWKQRQPQPPPQPAPLGQGQTGPAEACPTGPIA